MKGFLGLFELLDFNIDNRFWETALITIHKIEGAIFYACEMELIDRTQAAELAEMVEEKRNLIP